MEKGVCQGCHFRRLLLSVIAVLRAGEIAGFSSYLDSLSPPAPKKKLTSELPKATSKINSGYLDSLERPFEKAAAACTEIPSDHDAKDRPRAEWVEQTHRRYGEYLNNVSPDGNDATTAALEARNKAAPLEQASTTGESLGFKKVEKTPDDKETATETQKLLQQVKDAGTAGVLSYALWELGFWALSIPVYLVGYYQLTGHWPDLADPEDQKKLGAEAFAFVNVARFAVPLRIGLALGTAPWIDENIIRRFVTKEDDGEERAM